MKQTIVTAFVTTLVTNYLLASPILLFLLFWVGCMYALRKLDRWASTEEQSNELDFSTDPIHCLIAYGLAPIFLVFAAIYFKDKIIKEFKVKFPKFRLPKFRNPITW